MIIYKYIVSEKEHNGDWRARFVKDDIKKVFKELPYWNALKKPLSEFLIAQFIDHKRCPYYGFIREATADKW